MARTGFFNDEPLDKDLSKKKTNPKETKNIVKKKTEKKAKRSAKDKRFIHELLLWQRKRNFEFACGIECEWRRPSSAKI